MKTKQQEHENLATILAALRLFQRMYAGQTAKVIRKAWPEHFKGVKPLGTEDIDVLCKELNTADALQRHSVWFKDAEGNEDHLTALATDAEAQNIENHLQGLKESGTVGEFVVILDSPDSADEVIAYIDEKLEG